MSGTSEASPENVHLIPKTTAEAETAAGTTSTTTTATTTTGTSTTTTTATATGTPAATSTARQSKPTATSTNIRSTSSSTTTTAATIQSGPTPSANGGARESAVNAANGAGSVISNPTVIENCNWKFLIMDSPTDANVNAYIKVLQKKNVVAVVRACDPSYSDKPLLDAGIKVMHLPFSDGDPPPGQVVSKWLDFVEETIGPASGKVKKVKSAKSNGTNLKKRSPSESKDKRAIAVHCVAGLGRAPVLVCLALVESGMDAYDAISFIRKRRRGAINTRQLQYIENYKPRSKRTKLCCTIM